nr:BsuPI-related putative proteinase inhibitor [Bacillus alkalicola]
MFKIVLLIVMGTVFFVACGTSEETSRTGEGGDPSNEGEESAAEVIIEDLIFTLGTEIIGNELHIEMLLKNESDSDKELEFSSGQQYDIFIKDPEGNKLYHYAEEMMFTQALIYETIGSGETLIFEEVWESEEIHDLDYLEVEAQLLPSTIDGNIFDNEFQIVKTISSE